MASSALSFFLILIFFTSILAQERPNSLFIPTRKDPATRLHLTHIRKRTPLISLPLLVDVNGGLLWVTCDQDYTSTTYNAPTCHSIQCSRAGVHHCHKCPTPARPGCHNDTCGVFATNPLTRKNTASELGSDVISIQAFETSQFVTIRDFLFACAPSSLLRGPLPQGVRGIAGLGRTPISLPLQLASSFGFQPQFSMCLSSEDVDEGGVGILFGNIPENILPKTLTYTPLTIGANGEYNILTQSIKINHQDVYFHTSLRFAGTTISTTTPYTILHHSIYEPFIQFYEREATGTPRAKAVSPFTLCYNSRMLPPTRVGMPNIEFFFDNSNVSWTVFGYYALVNVGSNVSCLGFVDGGMKMKVPITIGVHQMENNFFHFDLVKSTFGFVPRMFAQCSRLNFNTTHLP